MARKCLRDVFGIERTEGMAGDDGFAQGKLCFHNVSSCLM
jgi:hypothetical protein